MMRIGAQRFKTGHTAAEQLRHVFARLETKMEFTPMLPAGNL